MSLRKTFLDLFHHGAESTLAVLIRIYLTRSENRGKLANQLVVQEGTTLNFLFSKSDIKSENLPIIGNYFCANSLELKSTLVSLSKKCKISPINDDGYETAPLSAMAHSLVKAIQIILDSHHLLIFACGHQTLENV